MNSGKRLLLKDEREETKRKKSERKFDAENIFFNKKIIF